MFLGWMQECPKLLLGILVELTLTAKPWALFFSPWCSEHPWERLPSLSVQSKFVYRLVQYLLFWVWGKWKISQGRNPIASVSHDIGEGSSRSWVSQTLVTLRRPQLGRLVNLTALRLLPLMRSFSLHCQSSILDFLTTQFWLRGAIYQHYPFPFLPVLPLELSKSQATFPGPVSSPYCFKVDFRPVDPSAHFLAYGLKQSCESLQIVVTSCLQTGSCLFISILMVSYLIFSLFFLTFTLKTINTQSWTVEQACLSY